LQAFFPDQHEQNMEWHIKTIAFRPQFSTGPLNLTEKGGNITIRGLCTDAILCFTRDKPLDLQLQSQH